MVSFSSCGGNPVIPTGRKVSIQGWEAHQDCSPQSGHCPWCSILEAGSVPCLPSQSAQPGVGQRGAQFTDGDSGGWSIAWVALSSNHPQTLPFFLSMPVSVLPT